MSAPWWTVEGGKGPGSLVDGPFGRRPKLADDDPRQVTKELKARRPSYTPEWAEPTAADAGGALAVLFGELAATVLKRLNRLPAKVMVELLRTAGVRPGPARAAEAIVRFTVAPAAPTSVAVPAGFQVGARPVGGGDLVVFETQDTTFVANAKVAEIYAQEGAVRRAITIADGTPDRPFPPLGLDPQPENALWIGLEAERPPTRSMTLAFGHAAASGIPRPAAVGGPGGASTAPAPLLLWEANIGAGFHPLEVLRDETRGLTQSGLVELRVPDRWETRPPEAGQDKPLRWLRLRLIQGTFEDVPLLASLELNVARVRAVRTVRNEVLEAIPDSNPTRMRVSQVPVVPGSLIVEVDEPVTADAEGGVARWREVDDLSDFGPDDQVFALDPDRGELSFGDGQHGATVPPGFRNARALKYEVGGGKAGEVGPGEITTLLNTAPFLTGVTNTRPAVGGADPEPLAAVVRQAPRALRTGGRAVTVADYALMAPLATGADVRRAHAISGAHPSFPGRPLAGVVNVLVVSGRRNGGPPVPDEGTLLAVARHLSDKVGVAGVEVVASSPAFRTIRTEVGFLADPAANPGEIIRRITESIDAYLDPLTGGDDEGGWPFGRPLVYSALLRRLATSIPGVRAIPRLRLFRDGVPQPPCRDVPLGPGELFWPVGHQVFPLETEGQR